MDKRLELLIKEETESITGKEFKEGIQGMAEDCNNKIFYVIDKKYEEEVDNLLLSKENNFFQKYDDYGLLFADKEVTRNLNTLIQAGRITIEDDSEIKISPVTFVNKTTDHIYNTIICEDELDYKIDGEIEAMVNTEIRGLK